jgi:hypothetical protein
MDETHNEEPSRNKHDAQTTRHMSTEGPIHVIAATTESSSFPIRYIWTPDDGHIDQNMLWLLNVKF